MIKDQSSKDLTEAEEIQKSWQEYTEGLYKNVLMTRITMTMWSYLELDILECEVKWALGSITTNKARGSDGIPAELLQTLKKWC